MTGDYSPPGFQGAVNTYEDGAVIPTTNNKCQVDGGTIDPLSSTNLGAGDMSYGFDADGRQASGYGSWSGEFCKGEGQCNPQSLDGSYTRTYDAENHLIGQKYKT